MKHRLMADSLGNGRTVPSASAIRAVVVAIAAVLSAPQTHAQSAADRPEFEVATVKLSPAGAQGLRIGLTPPGTFFAENASVRSLIMDAYDVKAFQLVGGPSWIGTERFNVTAKTHVANLDAPITGHSLRDAIAEADLMLRTLLEGRFQLKLHREMRELPIYFLTVAKGGPKLPPLKSGSCTPVGEQPAPGQNPFVCGSSWMGRNGRNLTLEGTGITMDSLIRWLSTATGRTVVDNTALTDPFDVHLEWAPEEMVAGQSAANGAGDVSQPANAADTSGATVFTALQEQLGLKLESGRGPVEILVVDSVERPTPD
jgi:bla regulator protein BlaR1